MAQSNSNNNGNGTGNGHGNGHVNGQDGDEPELIGRQMTNEEFQAMRQKAFEDAELRIVTMARDEVDTLVPLLTQNVSKVDELLRHGDDKDQLNIAPLCSLVVVINLMLKEDLCSYREARQQGCSSGQALVEAIQSFDTSRVSHHAYELLGSYFTSYEDTLHKEFTEEEVAKFGDAATALFRWADNIYTILTVRFDDPMDQEEDDS
ncbi:hypothetical protein SAMD00019534_099510 [Acytostelium subglobosum LB1]|uniref:hypothetical protein n=1 Tax=Acytostelium subglobosum LB1 TaxID=1410327 RepID=UPI000644EB4E|nr:hypothetical protein SAMD00019534_099510 [Acytostelium subglobosum LB1]GAM26776.1 hypothetical protein SAMD00019534_099510 [Acytostelium subglobosum LB1]|eukprot:XP_012750437.1 hypothetical protein SAMD00019534_099510 [Acytostelium subglobosum LB1]